MAGNITFTMIKPSALVTGHLGHIIEKIIEAEFKFIALKMFHLTRAEAEAFYDVHKGKPFYDGLVGFMTSGPVVAAVLQKENAVEEFRKIIGNTDPSKAAEGTIRKLFGESVQRNAIHGSDCDENAEREASFFFSRIERYDIF